MPRSVDPAVQAEAEFLFGLFERIIEPLCVCMCAIGGQGVALMPGIKDLDTAERMVLYLAQNVDHGRTIAWSYLDAEGTLHQLVQQVIDTTRN